MMDVFLNSVLIDIKTGAPLKDGSLPFRELRLACRALFLEYYTSSNVDFDKICYTSLDQRTKLAIDKEKKLLVLRIGDETLDVSERWNCQTDSADGARYCVGVNLVRKVSIVAPIGTSPPVIIEFLQYVETFLDQRVTDLTVITMGEPIVLEGLELVKAGVADRYPRVHLHVVELPYDDVDSEERSMEFIGITARILRDQKERYGAEVVYLCVAGGRKEVCIILSLLAQFYNVNGVYNIVMPDVKAFNQQLELIRYEVGELAQTEDKLNYYRQKKINSSPSFILHFRIITLLRYQLYHILCNLYLI